MKQILLIMATSAILGIATSCSNLTTSINNTSAIKPSNTNSNTVANAAITSSKDEETPTIVKAIFPNASSFTKQHKDIPDEAIAGLEKDSGIKLPDTDHHSYLAFSNADGTKKQIGAATIVKAGGKDVIVVYENKDGSPYIKEVKIEGISADFLKQFSGKGHDSKLQIGQDLKVNTVDEKLAKAIADAIRVDVITMQTLYGKAHSH
jgi:hypothetical protein